MSVKRVTESYTKGSIAGARRPPHSPTARTSKTGPDVSRPAAPKAPPKPAAARVDEAVMADIMAGIAALHQTQEEELQTEISAPAVSAGPEDPVTMAVADTEDLPQLETPSQSDKTEPAPELNFPVAVQPADDATATTEMADDLANVPSATSPGEPPAVNYREIITNTIARLEQNSADTRQAVYDHAREVVHKRLLGAQPGLSPDLIERERASLDRIIDEIEAEAAEKQAARKRILPARTVARPIEPVVIQKRRNLPQARHFHGGTLRLFAVAGLICASLLAYWFIAGRPGMKSAVAYLPALPGAAPVEQSADSTASQAAPTEQGVDAAPTQEAAQDSASISQDTVAEQPPSQDQPAPADPAVNEAARGLAGNPLMTFPLECSGAPCSNATPAPTNTDSASWIASYSAIKSPPRSNQNNPPVSAEAAKLLDAGRAAAAPSAIGSFQRGLDKAKNDDADGAIRDFTEAIRLDPNFADAFVQRGNARFKNGSPDLALTDFSDAIGIDGRNAAAFKARGMARLYNADEDGALDDLTKAIQIAEAEPTRLPPIDLFFARRTRAGIYSRKQAGDRELFDLSAMLDGYWKNPDLADGLKGNYGAQGAASLMATIYRQRAALYVARANTDGAVSDLSLALQLDPSRSIQLILERARILEAAGRREQAAADFQRVLQINPRVDEAKQAVVRLNARQ